MYYFLFLTFFYLTVYGQTADQILVRLGGDILLQSEFEFNKTELQKSGQTVQDCELFEEMILNKLLVQQAPLDSISVSEAEVKAEIEGRIQQMMHYVGGKENFEKNIGKKPSDIRRMLYDPIKENLIASRMRREILKNIKTTPQEVYNFYKTNEYNLPMIPEQVQLSQLIIEPSISKELNDEIYKELNHLRQEVQEGKMSMGMAAAVHSDDPMSRRRAGELGLRNRGSFLPEFEGIAYRLEPGQVSKVFKTQYGYHFLKVIERRGEMINVAHVLKKIKPSYETMEAAQVLADSIYQEIMSGKLDFEEAVVRFSTDSKTRNSKGILTNMMNQTHFFDTEQIKKNSQYPEIAYIQDMINALEGAEEGSITYPSWVLNINQDQILQMVRLDKKILAHTANLENDYALIEQMTKTDLEQKALQKWVAKSIEKNYVTISPNYKQCSFVHQWMK